MSSTSAKVFVVLMIFLLVGIVIFAYSATIPTSKTTQTNVSTSLSISKVTTTVNQTITQTVSNKIYHITVQFILFNNPQVQYILYLNGHSIGTGIIDSNSSIPIPTSSKGNVTISTLIQNSNNINQNVEVIIFNNGTTIAVGYNGVNQRNNVTGFVD